MKLLVMLIVSLLCAGSLTGCEEQGPFEEAGEEIDKTVDEASDELEEAGDEIEDAVDDIDD